MRNAHPPKFSRFTLSLALNFGMIFVCQAGGKLAMALDTTASSIPASISAAPQMINEALTPAERLGKAETAPVMPLLTGPTSPEWASMKLAASAGVATVTLAPVGAAPSPSRGLETPETSTQFLGMTEMASGCLPAGCPATDMALAASPTYVLQGINTSFAVYSTTGTLPPGWPKSFQMFFPPAVIANIKWFPAIPAGLEEMEGKILDKIAAE